METELHHSRKNVVAKDEKTIPDPHQGRRLSSATKGAETGGRWANQGRWQWAAVSVNTGDQRTQDKGPPLRGARGRWPTPLHVKTDTTCLCFHVSDVTSSETVKQCITRNLQS